jgi:hypothetical protein
VGEKVVAIEGEAMGGAGHASLESAHDIVFEEDDWRSSRLRASTNGGGRATARPRDIAAALQVKSHAKGSSTQDAFPAQTGHGPCVPEDLAGSCGSRPELCSLRRILLSLTQENAELRRSLEEVEQRLGGPRVPCGPELSGSDRGLDFSGGSGRRAPGGDRRAGPGANAAAPHIGMVPRKHLDAAVGRADAARRELQALRGRAAAAMGKLQAASFPMQI